MYIDPASGCRSRSCCTLQWLVSIVDSARQIRRKDRVPLAINDEGARGSHLRPLARRPLPGSTGPLYWVVSSLNHVNFRQDGLREARTGHPELSRTCCCAIYATVQVPTPYSLWSSAHIGGPTGPNSFTVPFVPFVPFVTAWLLYLASKSQNRRIDFFLFSRLGLLGTGCGTRVLCSVRLSQNMAPIEDSPCRGCS